MKTKELLEVIKHLDKAYEMATKERENYERGSFESTLQLGYMQGIIKAKNVLFDYYEENKDHE